MRASSTRCPRQQRRERALAGFAALFGEPLGQPIDYVDHCWGTEEFAPGGPTAAVPPGSWTTYGPWLRKPVDGIFWAGTETADEWTGFLDGAVRSGKRAAAEVHRALIRLGARRVAPRLTDSISHRRCLLTSSGRSRIAQCPPGSSTNVARLGAVAAMRRDETIGSRRSFWLPMTSVGTVRFFSPMCCGPRRVDQRSGPAAAAGGAVSR